MKSFSHIFIYSVHLQIILSCEIENATGEINNDETFDANYNYSNLLEHEQKSNLDILLMDDTFSKFNLVDETATQLADAQHSILNETVFKITKCAVDIIDEYSENGFLWIENDSHLYRNEILQKTNKPFRIFSAYTLTLDLVKFAVVTLSTSNLDHLMLTKLQRLSILIIYSGDNPQLLLENLWKLSYNKVAVITTDLFIIGYPEFKMTNCKRVIYKRVFGECGKELPNDLFKFEPLKDYRGCKVRFFANVIVPYVINPFELRNPGYEILTLLDISRRLNFSIEFLKHDFNDWGYELKNGSYTDMYGLLYEKKVDFVMGMVMANESFLKDFQCTHPHAQGNIAFFLPAASVLEPWKNLVLIFVPSLWYYIIATIVFVVLIWWIFGKALGEEYQHVSYSFTQVWSVYLFVSVRKPSSRLMKTLFILWIFFSFIVNSIYQGVLISFLTTPTYEHQIDSLEEMVEAQFPRGGYFSLHYLFENQDSKTDWDIYQNYIKCDLSVRCTNRTAFQKDMATFKNIKQIRYQIPKYYLDENGRCMLYQLKPSAFFHIWMVTYKGHPLYDSVNSVLLRMLQNGLILKYDLDLEMKIVGVPDGDVEPLTLKHLQAAFYLIAIGLGLSLIVFVVEIVLFRNREK